MKGEETRSEGGEEVKEWGGKVVCVCVSERERERESIMPYFSGQKVLPGDANPLSVEDSVSFRCLALWFEPHLSS